jgi:hypothetical protein
MKTEESKFDFRQEEDVFQPQRSDLPCVPLSVLSWGSFPGVKATDHSPLSYAEVKNMWSCTSPFLSFMFMMFYLIRWQLSNKWLCKSIGCSHHLEFQ